MNKKFKSYFKFTITSGGVRWRRFIPRGRTRLNLIVLLIVLLGFCFALVDYVPAYQYVASNVNKGLDSINWKQDRWGVVDFFDRNLRLPEFDREYSLGLDLVGGARVVYDTDVTGIEEAAGEDASESEVRTQKQEALDALRDSIEQRVNFLGVSEPSVYIQGRSVPDQARLVVELSGIENPGKAVEEIGKTPLLEFRELKPESEYIANLEAVFEGFKIQLEALREQTQGQESTPVDIEQLASIEIPSVDELEAICNGGEIIWEGAQGTNLGVPAIGEGGVINYFNLQYLQRLSGEDASSRQDYCFNKTQLTGQYLDRAYLPPANALPVLTGIGVHIQFNEQGAQLFEEITTRNISKPLEITLDGVSISIATVNSTISGGEATISGGFDRETAQRLVSNLNSGALPIPITKLSDQQVGATLGKESVNSGLRAGIAGLIAVLAFMMFVYRVSGVMAVLSLMFYVATLLALIKLIPVTLSLAGIAGLVLSIGMAVDANVLVFERLREELEKEKNIIRAIDDAFSRTWSAVRDGNLSTLITALILFFLTTSFVQGFAITLALGILVSMFSSMVVTRYFLKALAHTRLGRYKFIWNRSFRTYDTKI